jgi:hypothetical protein
MTWLAEKITSFSAAYSGSRLGPLKVHRTLLRGVFSPSRQFSTCLNVKLIFPSAHIDQIPTAYKHTYPNVFFMRGGSSAARRCIKGVYWLGVTGIVISVTGGVDAGSLLGVIRMAEIEPGQANAGPATIRHICLVAPALAPGSPVALILAG